MGMRLKGPLSIHGQTQSLQPAGRVNQREESLQTLNKGARDGHPR